MFDLIIVGSGPAGLTAAIYAERANLNALVIEKEYLGTGQIAESGRVDNYPGLSGLSGYELGEKLREHALSAGMSVETDTVIGIEVTTDAAEERRVFRLTCESGTAYEASAVIYAAGAHPVHGGISGEETFAGKGVSYCALCDGTFYRDKTVAVLGGGDTALDDALYLSELCEQVFLIHRRNEFRGAESTLELLKKKDNVTILTEEKAELIYGGTRAEGLRLASGRDLKVAGIFIAFGSVPNTRLAGDLVEIDENGYIMAVEDGKTDLPGFFVAGDVRTKPVRQVVTAVSDGANAAISAYKYISGLKRKDARD